MEVTALAATGMTNKMIADRLGIKLDTVKLHMTQAMKEMGVRNRVELALAYRGIDFRAERGS